MERVGIRALQQNAAAVLRRVRRGEILEVTDRGRRVAVLAPVEHADVVERLQAAGRITEAEGDLLELCPPVPRRKDAESASERLGRMRDRER